MKFKAENIITVLTPEIPDGWELYGTLNQTDGIKIRRPYNDDEIAINEDGYMYNTIFLSVYKTAHYLRLTNLGYKISID